MTTSTDSPDDLPPTRPVPGRGPVDPGDGGESEPPARAPSSVRELGPPPDHARYVVRDVLGRGGQGVVWRVADRELGRDVAMKTLDPRKVSLEITSRFLREAQATAVLEHPNIVPIYDVGTLADGRPFYTMRLVPGRSFWDVLAALRADEIEGREDPEWSLVRLLQVAQQACLALQFAHERGVVHRDVKPANLLLGEHGEVLLVDWGIAKSALGTGPQTTTGVAQGTVHYMSPEQARGDKVDARTDVYAMGVVLYECLSLRLPHDETSQGELLAAILRDEPPPPERRTRRVVPHELSALALRAMAKKRDQRIASARELHDELQAFVEGVADRARRAREASRLTGEGVELLARHEATLRELADGRARLDELGKEHPSWQPLEEKEPLLLGQRRVEDLERRSRTEMLQAVHRLTDALAHDPEHADARSRLADTFLHRLREAERDRDDAMSEVWLSLVERYHDGRHARELAGHGSVRVVIEPPHVEWALHRLVEQQIALVDGPVVASGRGSIEIPELAMGSYVVVARAEGCEPARYPVAIFRNTDWEGELRLLPAGSIPDGFVYVPGTWTWLGGDPQAVNSWPLRRVWVDSFLMARFPVTFREWCEFLDRLPSTEAASLAPRTESMGGLCALNSFGRHEPSGIAAALGATTRARMGGTAADALPVIGVTESDARTFAARSLETGPRPMRLPTAAEWELAARGVDRRAFPWGIRHDAAACHGRETLRDVQDLLPVGHMTQDVSVYGVRDMGGLVHEFTSDWFDPERGLLEVRGGSWVSAGSYSRCATRQATRTAARAPNVGLRLATGIMSSR